MSEFRQALEYGSGTGLLSFALKDDLSQITLMDESVEMTAVAKEKCARAALTHLHPIRMDLLSEAYQPATRFDLVFILLTLHHIADTDSILARFQELMQPGGVLALIDLEKEDGTFHDQPFTGHLGFDRQELEGQLKAAGFQPFHYEVVYEIEKGEGADKKYYPLFLLLARS
jgi:predicted TPR repeat methyltransferase